MKKRVKITYNGSDVILTLTLGKTIRHVCGGITDEGFCYEQNEYTLLDDGHVELIVQTAAMDCDGRLDTYDRYISTTPASNLETMQWERIDGNQYDYAAAAAGY